MTQSIAPTELATLRSANPRLLLVDVRTPAEFTEIHAEGARLMPLDRLDPAAVQGARQGDEPAYVICRTGSRAKQAAEKLSAAGCNAVVVEGGTGAWEAAGLPVKRGRRTISVERQVRIGAGSLVLVGVLLAWLVHPVFMLLSGFVGAGLIFAGVTDICGMALLLGRMPWNQAHVDEADLLRPPTTVPTNTPSAAPSGAVA